MENGWAEEILNFELALRRGGAEAMGWNETTTVGAC